MDRSSLRTHLERHHRVSYGWALHCCARDPEVAADVLQTAYLKVLDGEARYDGRAAFKTWLFAVIRHTAADARRRRARRSSMMSRLRLAKPEETFRIEALQEGSERRLDRSRLQALFRQALDGLSERQREVLLLVMYHDLTLEEAARVMDVSLGSARTHYDRGKKRLRQWLESTDALDDARYRR